MIKLGELNSRVKDFFDIWSLATSREFDGKTLSTAITRTFAQRRTALTSDAICFQDSFGHSKAKQEQWRAFVNRSNLTGLTPALFSEAWRTVLAFLLPMAEEGATNLRWHPCGPWSPQER